MCSLNLKFLSKCTPSMLTELLQGTTVLQMSVLDGFLKKPKRIKTDVKISTFEIKKV